MVPDVLALWTLPGRSPLKILPERKPEEIRPDERAVPDLEGLLGRITSASYMPNVDEEERFTALTQDVTRLFEGSEKKGKVRLLYDAFIFLGPVVCGR